MNITPRVTRRAKRMGVRVMSRKAWGSKYPQVYKARRRRAVRQPADTVWQHITVTHALNDFRVCCQTVERIGYERFGSGVSYNFLVHIRTGQAAVGQPLDAPGTHTIVWRNDLLSSGNWSKDQNYAARAIAVIGMPGDELSKAAEDTIVVLLTAMALEGAITPGFDYMPHSFAVAGTPYAKDCPTDALRDAMPRIRKRVDDNVRKANRR